MKINLTAIVILLLVLACGGLAAKIVSLQDNLQSASRIGVNQKQYLEKYEDQISELKSARDKVEREKLVLQDALKDRAVQLGNYKKENSELRSRLDKLFEAVKDKNRSLESNGQALDELRKTAVNLKASLETVTKREAAADAALKSSRTELVKLKEETDRLKKELAEKESEMSRAVPVNMPLVRSYLDDLENKLKLCENRAAGQGEELSSLTSLMTKIKAEKERYKEEAVRTHFNLGVLFTREGDIPKAVREYERALVIKPNDADTHYNLGYVYDEFLKDNAKALEHYAIYLRLAPMSKDAAKVRRWIAEKDAMNK